MAFLKSIWKTNGKHKKLSEELALQIKDNETENEIEISENPENDNVTFKLKYLGSTVVEKLTGESISIEAVKNIIKVAKASRKKLQRVNVAISLKGIAVTDLQGNDMFKISIYRISNCSTDASHRQVFSFISTDTNETMECHAFLCSKRKIAETVALAVAHAFSTAYEAWRVLPSTKQFEQNALESENTQNQNLPDNVAQNQLTQNLLSKNLSQNNKGQNAGEIFKNALNNLQNDVKAAQDFTNLKNWDLTPPPASSENILKSPANNKIDAKPAVQEQEEKLIDFDDDGFDDSQRNQWVSFEDDFSSPKWNQKPDLILA